MLSHSLRDKTAYYTEVGSDMRVVEREKSRFCLNFTRYESMRKLKAQSVYIPCRDLTKTARRGRKLQ